MSYTEWHLQIELTRRWSTTGAIVHGQRLFLVAWEVMVPSWRINDSTLHWNEPSIDFLFLDEQGTLHVMEGKKHLASPRSCWNALCQVTHRAILLHQSFSFEKLNQAYTHNYTYDTDRVIHAPIGPTNLLTAHKGFFGLKAPLPQEEFNKAKPKRIVCALGFSPTWHATQQKFVTSPESQVAEHLRSRYKTDAPSNREMRRLIDLGCWRVVVAPGVASHVVSLS